MYYSYHIQKKIKVVHLSIAQGTQLPSSSPHCIHNFLTLQLKLNGIRVFFLDPNQQTFFKQPNFFTASYKTSCQLREFTSSHRGVTIKLKYIVDNFRSLAQTVINYGPHTVWKLVLIFFLQFAHKLQFSVIT